MKLIIKNLKQVPYEVEVADDQITVMQLKQAIEEKHRFEADKLKLLYNGVILDNTKKLADYQIKEGFVIIMMGSKLKIENAPKPEEKKEEANAQPAGNANPQPAATTSNQPAQPSSQPSAPAQPQRPAQPAKDYTNEINQMMEMGIGKEEAEKAIKAARGNLNVAIEFVYNGIPSNLPMDDDMNDFPAGQEGAGGENAPQGNGLRQVASIIKVLSQQNPNALQSILFNIQQTDPNLFQLITQNEEEFKNLLDSPVTNEDYAAFNQFSQQISRSRGGAPGMGGMPGMGGHGGGVPRGGIQVTREEYEAIKRLKELGFSEAEAAQAYMAFDKNEEAAANFLFENKMQEESLNFVITNPQGNQPSQPSQPQASASQPQAPAQANNPNPPEEKKEEEKKGEEKEEKEKKEG